MPNRIRTSRPRSASHVTINPSALFTAVRPGAALTPATSQEIVCALATANHSAPAAMVPAITNATVVFRMAPL
jgi:hypothetical protein